MHSFLRRCCWWMGIFGCAPLAWAQFTGAWHITDVGVPAPTPSGTVRTANGQEIITAGGAGVGGVDTRYPGDIGGNSPESGWGTYDSFSYRVRDSNLYDEEMVVRLVSLDGPDGAQAGLMVRSEMSRGAVHMALVYRKGEGLALLTRREPISGLHRDGRPGNTYTPLTDTSVTLPLWIKLHRYNQSGLFSTSTDGINWTPRYWDTLQLGTRPWLGIAVSSHENGVAATATLDNIRAGAPREPMAAPAPPANFTVRRIESESISFDWTPDPVGTERIELERSTSGGPFEPVYHSHNFGADDASVTGGGTYTYRARFARGPVYSDYTPPLTVTTPFVAAPTGLVAEMSGTNAVALRWTDHAADEGGFEVEVRSSATPWLRFVPANETTSTFELVENVTYYFRVRAVKTNARSTFSNEVSVRLGAPPTGGPTITAQPEPRWQFLGGSVTLAVTAAVNAGAYRWEWNGRALPTANESTLSLVGLQPQQAGVYTAVVADSGGEIASTPVIVGVVSTRKVAGAATEVGTDIRHPNGNVYDQVLLQGTSTSVTCHLGQVVRISFVDLSDDIVQVEFSGAGTLTLTLDSPSGPSPAANYNQPGVQYMKGHAGIVITGANETTNLAVFSVGRMTAVNQALFRNDIQYDGVADIAFIAILGGGGRFGGIYCGNTSFWATRGVTGIYAPNVWVGIPINVCDIIAHEEATPAFLFNTTEANVTGGDFEQPNGRPIRVGDITRIRFVNGSTSHGEILPARQNRGRLQARDGSDATDRIVVNP